ncbi:DNA-binding transcriptional regulator, MarR family [Formivibrio citricus]|uniref:DNA-binding transcriptional regulator, MarR family n=2 Tax=Formivibrio citricus TaxID=83765 RepID=A0A1I4YXC4_9NEIS|nr:DNA-binding transcriptional regulator, MarR family [Formivibrio citricus]
MKHDTASTAPPHTGKPSTPASTGTELDMEVLRQFRIIFKSVRKHFQEVEDRLGISGSLLWALSEISVRPGISVSELAKTMSIHQSTASNILSKLVGLGLVSKTRNGKDNRITGLFISGQGQVKLGLAPAPVRGLLPEALGKLPYATLRDLHKNLNVLLAMFESADLKDKDTPLAEI